MDGTLVSMGLEMALALVAGLLAGWLHFGALRLASGLMLRGAALPVLLLGLARFAVTAGTLILAAQLGALPLLSALAGILAARSVVLRAGVRQ